MQVQQLLQQQGGVGGLTGAALLQPIILNALCSWSCCHSGCKDARPVNTNRRSEACRPGGGAVTFRPKREPPGGAGGARQVHARACGTDPSAGGGSPC